MANINKLCATMLLMRASLTAQKAPNQLPFAPDPGSITRIEPAAFSAALADLSSLLRADSTLELLFAEALPPAALFLLFRLKRSGFSACRAIATPDGILLTARR